MKKLLTFVVGFTLVLPAVASAASFAVVPSTGSYAVGDLITLKVSIDPVESTVYTAVLNAHFSPDVFEIVSFSPASGVLSLQKPGYDAIDNVGGVLIKTNGYPGGIHVPTRFGTLVVRAKRSGEGTFTVDSTSQILNAKNINEQSGAQTVSFTITPASVRTTVPESLQVVENNGITVAPTSTSESTISTAGAQLAAVAEFVMSNGLIFSLLAVLIVLIGVGLFMNKREVEK